jgi:hypothetical protein
MQFLSESMGWLDNIIFAMAPIGIITAIVASSHHRKIQGKPRRR